jgi:hypothetical protein
LPGAIVNPTIAVKTASSITRGFASATKSARRALTRDREGKGRREAGIAVVFMIVPLRRQSFAVAAIRDFAGAAGFTTS